MDTKWEYIDRINSLSNAYDTTLFEMMFKYKKKSLSELTIEECKDFYNSLINKLCINR